MLRGLSSLMKDENSENGGAWITVSSTSHMLHLFNSSRSGPFQNMKTGLPYGTPSQSCTYYAINSCLGGK